MGMQLIFNRFGFIDTRTLVKRPRYFISIIIVQYGLAWGILIIYCGLQGRLFEAGN